MWTVETSQGRLVTNPRTRQPYLYATRTEAIQNWPHRGDRQLVFREVVVRGR